MPGDRPAQGLHDQVHGLVARGPHQGDVEADVGLVELLRPDAGPPHVRRAPPGLRQPLRVVPPRRLRDRRGLEGGAELHQVADRPRRSGAAG